MLHHTPIVFSSPPAPQTLIQGVHAWLLDLDLLSEMDSNAFRQLLSPSEIERASSLKRQQREFIFQRAFLRYCLSHYLGIPPDQVELAVAKHGKPFIANSPQPLAFNLSHSGTQVLLALTAKSPIGVDIEVPRAHNLAGIAQRFFHPDELAQLNQAPADQQSHLFFRLWTLKEAFFKALGGGIATGLEKIQFYLAGSNHKVQISSVLQQSPDDWQFYYGNTAAHIPFALAVASPEPLPVVWFQGSELLMHAAEHR